MVGLKRERDTLRGEVVALRSDRARLQASEAEQQRRAAASEAKTAQLERELERTATAQRPLALATPEPVRHSETLAGSAFAPGAATLREEALPQLNVIAAWLRAEPAGTVVIEGHTDASGDAEANRRLSLARAEAVRDGLIALGLAHDRLEVLGRGEQLPVADNATEEGRATNRRVVVTLEP
jgi:outer membrane protein OmpA-like peptidoglycan-associated protein